MSITKEGKPDKNTSAALNIDQIRRDFPILSEPMRGKPFVYLDNGATSLKPQCVIDEVVRYYSKIGANIHRGVYEFSETASLLYDTARENVARFINAGPDGQIIFTKGATEAVNLLGYGWGYKNITEGDEIVVSELEHHANFVPWQMLAQRTGATLKFIPVDPHDGSIVLDDLDTIITEKTRLVAISAMSNVTGYMPPVPRIIAAAKAVGAVTVVDGAQLVSHHPVDVQELDCDFLVFSSHKMLGPTGVGVLYGKSDILRYMDPFLYGGDMILKVRKDITTFQELPGRFEAGTPNIAGVLGFGKAIEYLEKIGMENIQKHERDLLEYATARADEIPELEVYGSRDLDSRGGIFSFNVAGVHPHDTGAILDQEGIAVRTGFHCAHPLIQILGVPGTTRASFYLYNTRDDIDRLMDGIDRVKGVFL